MRANESTEQSLHVENAELRSRLVEAEHALTSIANLLDFETSERTGLAAAIRDLTNRTAANAALFSKLIEQAPGGVYVVDAQFRVAQMNAKSLPFFASVQPLIGRDFDEVLEIVWGPEIGPQCAKIFRHTLATGERYVSPRFSEQRHDTAEEQAFEWETQRITLPDGQHGVVCYFKDVTARERAEAALRLANERFDLAVKCSQVVLFQQDLELRYTWLQNPVPGFEGSIPIGKRDAEMMERAEDAAVIEALKREVIRSGVSQRQEVLVHIQGVGRHFDLLVAPLRDAAGVISGVTCAAIDITQRKRADEARHEMEQNYRVLADASSEIPYRMSADWSTMLPLDGRGLLASSNGPLAGWAWVDKYLPPDEQDRIRQTIGVAIAEKRLFEMEHRVLRLDGSTGWVHSRSVPILDENEEVTGWFGAVNDITRRKQAEDAVLVSEQRLGAILDQLPVAVSVMNFDGQVTLTNPPMRRFVQKLIPSLDPQRQNRWRAWKADGSPLQPEDWPGQRAIRGETVVPGVDFLFTDDGREVWTNVATSPLRDGNGAVGGAVVVIQDIDDRKRADEALRESEARLGAVLRLSPVGIIRTDAEGRMTLVNPRWCEMLGYSEVELLGRRLVEFLHPSSKVSTDTAYDRLITGGSALQVEKAFCRKDGSVLSAQSNVAAVRSPAGEFLGMVHVVMDISERLHSEAELRRLAAELAEADRRKDVFLATLAHELRNPLAPIRNGLHLMSMSRNNGETIEKVRAMMDRQLTQLVRLVDDLLDVSRITQGKVELRKERVDLKAVIDAAVETSRPAIEQAGHELAVVTDEPIFVYGDAARLAQVVSNLLHNSVKYTHRGGRIRLTATREDGTAVVSVKDNGIGIPPAMIGRVFEMFAQLDRTLEKTTGGLGIGLSLVKALLEMHGGTIEARSGGEGMGSEFVVRLPVVMDIGVRPDPPDVKTSEVVPSALRRVLVVDDNVDSADSLGQLLKLLGNEVRTANDGEAGIGVAAQFRPDLVLMDIGMPKLNGYEAARRIRQQPWGRGMVLVALTGWGQEDDRKESADAGFDHHLVKPVELQALMKLMSRP